MQHCECQSSKDPNWRHGPKCDRWLNVIEPSVRAFIFLSPLLEDWKRLRKLFRAPPNGAIYPPHDVNKWVGNEIGDRHPIYKVYKWTYGEHLAEGKFAFYWAWAPEKSGKPPVPDLI